MSRRSRKRAARFDPLHIGWPLWIVSGSAIFFFQTFTKVTFPIIRPGILTGAIFAFMIAFDEVGIALFTCGTTAITLPKKMWDVIRYEIEPMLPAIVTAGCFYSRAGRPAAAACRPAHENGLSDFRHKFTGDNRSAVV